MSTPADYQNRTYDLLALQGARPTGAVELSQTLFDVLGTGEICTGIQKLVQAWVLEFLTIQGSLPFAPLTGCSFMAAVESGQLQTESDVQLAFNLAQITVYENLRRTETSDTPPDEQYAGARLLVIQLHGDSLSLTVAVSSVAGDKRQVILPISLLPTPVGA